MHRNTITLIVILAILAALVTGISIGHRFSPQTTSNQQSQTSPGPSPLTYSNSYCGISFAYPAEFTVEKASDSATLTNKASQEKINLLCGTDFPKPPLPKEKIETASVAGQLATIYHDASAKDGKPVDVVVFINPKNKLEVALFGFGEVYNKIVKGLKIDK